MAELRVNWRERDLGTLRAEIQADQGVRRVLARFGVLKFVENPLMRAGEPLLARIISYWDPDQEIFVVQGHRIELTVQDVYFLTGLPPLGIVGDTQPVLPRGRHIMEFVERHCRPGFQVKGTRISIGDLERLETRAVAAAVLRILGTQAFHHITGGQMMIVESVLSGTYFGWAQMMLVSLKRQLSLCRRQVNHDCSYGTLLCAFFFEKIPTLRPRVHLPDGGPREPRMRRWGRLLCKGGGGAVGRTFRPEFFAHWDQMPLYIDDYPYSGMSYCGDPDLPLPPGRVWGPDGK